MTYKCEFKFSYSDMESKQRLFLGDAEIDLDDSATLLNAKDERIAELEKAQDIRDLEQQAKGINDLLLTLVKSNGEPLKVDNLTNLIVHARYMANKLGEQAKALKEQEQANGMDAVWKLAKEQGV